MKGGFEQAVRPRALTAGVALTAPQIAALATYYELLSRWTRTINLTSLPLEGYPEPSIDRLIIEPLVAARSFRGGSHCWLDLGTGSGSPAIPMRILQPGGSLEMIESRERKAAFLREAVRTLELERTEVRTSRIEELAESRPAVADAITMRAVKPTFLILHAAAHLLAAAGRFFVFASSGTARPGDADALRDAGLKMDEMVPLLEGYELQIFTRR